MNFLDPIPLLVISLVSGFSIIVSCFFVIYCYRCYDWKHDTNDIFKDVDKEIDVNYKEAIPVKPVVKNVNNGGGGTIQSSSGLKPEMDWTEMSEMSSPNSGKHSSYQRTGSKDSMEVTFIHITTKTFRFSRK